MVKPVIVVHGGAWDIPDNLVEENLTGIKTAVQQGWKVLKEGGSALKAVVAAVNNMEDNPTFDAGIGSVLTEDKTVEMDALIMNGSNLEAGAVACLRNIKNPINLARIIMERTPHVMVIGEGALRIAKQFGVENISQKILVTDEARDELNRWLDSEDEFGSTFRRETVGAVALDANGHLAAATSTGGITGKRVGRIGDVPIVGSGGYADDLVGAVSSTGHGESIMKVNLAKLVLSYIDAGMHVQEAAEKALDHMSVRVNGNGGLIAVDSDGNIAHAFTTKRMVWASIKENVLKFGIDS